MAATGLAGNSTKEWCGMHGGSETCSWGYWLNIEMLAPRSMAPCSISNNMPLFPGTELNSELVSRSTEADAYDIATSRSIVVDMKPRSMPPIAPNTLLW